MSGDAWGWLLGALGTIFAIGLLVSALWVEQEPEPEEEDVTTDVIEDDLVVIEDGSAEVLIAEIKSYLDGERA